MRGSCTCRSLFPSKESNAELNKPLDNVANKAFSCSKVATLDRRRLLLSTTGMLSAVLLSVTSHSLPLSSNSRFWRRKRTYPVCKQYAMCGHIQVHQLTYTNWSRVAEHSSGTPPLGFSSPDAPYRDVLHPVQLGYMTVDLTTALRTHAFPRGSSCLRQN